MESDGYQVLSLPYVGGLSMDVILPTGGNSAANLNVGALPADLSTWLSGLQSQPVNVSLPKFDISAGAELGSALQSLGMTDAFSNGADFSGITNATQLKISAVVQKATISVNETGTVAAAATGVGMQTACIVMNLDPPIVFNADHPFLFLIRDNVSGSVLFMGQEMDPTSTSGDPSAPPLGTATAPAPGTTQQPPATATQPSPPTLSPVVLPVSITITPTTNPPSNPAPTATTSTPIGPMPWHRPSSSTTTSPTPTTSEPTASGPTSSESTAPVVGSSLSRPIGPLPWRPLH